MSVYNLEYGKRPTTVVSFRLTADDLDPKAITELLGVNPTEFWSKGDLRGTSGDRVYTFGCWELAPNCSKYDDFEKQIEVLLDQLEKLPPVFAQLVETFGAIIEVGYSSGEFNFGFFLSLETIKRLAKLNLPIDFDAYAV